MDNRLPYNEQAQTLDPADALILEDQHALGPIITNNKRLFSERTIAALSGISTASLTIDTDTEAQLIPTEILSSQTLEFLGYDAPTAEVIWQRFLTCDDHEDVRGIDKPNLADMARGNIRGKADDAENLLDDWHATLRGWGINDELRNAIMHNPEGDSEPSFQSIRLTETAKYWVQEAMKGRWYRLGTIYERSRTRLRRREKRRLENPESGDGYTAEDVYEKGG